MDATPQLMNIAGSSGLMLDNVYQRDSQNAFAGNQPVIEDLLARNVALQGAYL